MFKQAFFWLFCCFISNVYAQSKLEMLRNKGDELLAQHNYQQAIIQFKSGLELAKQNDEVFYESTFLVNIGVAYESLNNWSMAEEYYNYAIVIAQKHNDELNLAFANRNLALINIRKGLYNKAYKQLISATRYFKHSNIIDGLANTYTSIGNLEYKRENYNEAAYYYKAAIVLIERLVQTEKDSLQRQDYLMDFAILLNNLGDYYKLKRQYDLAIRYLDSALHIKVKISNQEHTANTMLGLGEVYLNQNDMPHALYYCQNAYQIRKRIADVKGIPEAANSLAEIFIRLNKFEAAAALLKEAKDIALADTLRKDLLRTYDISRKLYQQTKEFEKAVLFDQLYIDLLNILRDEKLNKQIEELKIQYQTEESKREFDIQLKENEQERLMLFGSILILLLFAIIISWAYFQKKRDRDKIELLMRELNHRVKNNLQVLSSILSLHYEQLSDKHSKQLIRETEGRVRAMSFVHRKLYKGKMFTQVVLNIFIKELVEELKTSYGFNSENFIVTYRLDEVVLEADKAIAVGLLLNEVLTNTFKHAYHAIPNPELTIELTLKHKEVMIVIKDNGQEADIRAKADSFGIQLIKLLSKQIKAEVSLANESGTRTQIKFMA